MGLLQRDEAAGDELRRLGDEGLEACALVDRERHERELRRGVGKALRMQRVAVAEALGGH